MVGGVGPSGYDNQGPILNMSISSMSCMSPNNQYCVTAAYNSSSSNWYACANDCSVVSLGLIKILGCCQTTNCNNMTMNVPSTSNSLEISIFSLLLGLFFHFKA